MPVSCFLRCLIYPFLMRGGKPMPLLACTMAIMFCTFNGYLQSRYLSHWAVYADDWVTDPRFLIGECPQQWTPPCSHHCFYVDVPVVSNEKSKLPVRTKTHSRESSRTPESPWDSPAVSAQLGAGRWRRWWEPSPAWAATEAQVPGQAKKPKIAAHCSRMSRN